MATKRTAASTSAFDTHYETERHFKNVHYGEKLCTHVIPPEEESKRKQALHDHTKSFVDSIVNRYPPEKLAETGDFSAYSGSCGVALMFFRLYERSTLSDSNDSSSSDYYLDMTRKYAEISANMYTPSKRKPLLTFWCGGPGPFALMAILHKINKEDTKVKQYVGKIMEYVKWIYDNSFDSDELLYGRAGLLYGLMFVNKYLKDDTIHTTCVDIAKAILKRGKMLDSQSPLMYEWHEKKYLGGAHGLSGILYLLLDLKEILSDEQYLKDIVGSIDFLASQEFPSGNYPSREGSSTDELVQWCHGATAIAILFCKAEKLLKDTRWRKHAERAANCIWKRGLLKKGVGLCHGISGNGYVLLNMFNLTQDRMYYEQAWKFCEFSWGEKGVLTYNAPDELYCLANGLAGAVTFYLDMLEPSLCNWLGFDV